MIRNDLHIHSSLSICGMHSVLEIVKIASNNGMRLINISDHGFCSGKPMGFGVLTDKRRFPQVVELTGYNPITVLAGIEANIVEDPNICDIPNKNINKFDLISASFHPIPKLIKVGGDEGYYTSLLEGFLAKHPLDILTHPCIKTFPLNIEKVVELSCKYGFALEVNNTNLRVDKTDIKRLKKMVLLAIEKGALLVENSDGHTFVEIGQNEMIENFLESNSISSKALFLNDENTALEKFIVARKALRG